jgi:transketolase|tara:strand:+ start:8005 stop:8931 length:927 start_codon:yes stop_codon:yes gene_type:complete
MSKKLRQEFADTMLEVGRRDQRLVVLIGDISHFALQPFAEGCPSRYYNIGICEPSTVNMAAGLSKVGLIPVVHTIAPFLVERSLEQIKLDFGYQKLGVNLVAVGSAFDYGALGCTHHCYGDFAILKTIENMEIIYPASCKEFNLLFKETYDNGNPTYFRIPEAKHEFDFSDDQIKFGKGIVAKEGKDITVIALGPHLKTAMHSIDMLEERGIDPEIIYYHTIKPLDVDTIRKSVSKTKRCIVIEEHSMYGGVYDDVIRCCNDLDNVRYSSINLGDTFIHSYGSYADHCNRLGLTPENLTERVVELHGI